MKVFSPVVAVSALGVAVVRADASGFRGHRALTGAVAFPSELKTVANADSYHMSTVRVVQARVQGDKPSWNADIGAFVSKYYTVADEAFRGVLDTVNTASVEGSLMYVQAEGINYATRGADTASRCTRKNKMKFVVFYDLVITQTNETLAQYDAEYGPFLAMDGGQCTPTSVSGNTTVFPTECYAFNGDDDAPNLGPFVGGEPRDTDPRAPYPNTWWYSLPNSCPLQKWGSAKSDACRASTRTGLCTYDTKPDGLSCTFNYRILGWVPLDDLVGITAMPTKADATKTYTNFSQFCLDGGVEFNATADGGVWIDGIDFWKKPQDSTANAARATALADTYRAALAGTATLTQVAATDFAHFQPLPTVADLRTQNPPCYKNVAACATATHGCKRDLYGQICAVCSAAASDCVVAPSSFTFPTLAKATSSAATETPTVTTEAPAATTAKTPATTTPSSTSSPASAGSESKSSSVSVLAVVLGSVGAVVVLIGALLLARKKCIKSSAASSSSGRPAGVPHGTSAFYMETTSPRNL